MEKVLLTGAAGFLGKTLITELLKHEYKVIAFDIASSDISSLKRKNVEIIKGDVRDKEKLEQGVKKADYIIHAAAAFSGSWDAFYEVNVEATESLLQLSEKYKVKRFVYISSISVHKHIGLKNQAVIKEDTPYEIDKFHSFYTKSKMEAEKVIKRFMDETDVSCTIIRPGSLYGPGGPLFPARMGMGFGVSRIILIGNTKSNIPLAYVENVAIDTARLLKEEKAAGQAFNLVESQALSRKEYFSKLKYDVNPYISKIWIPYWFMALGKFGLKILFKFIGGGKKPPLSDLLLEMLVRSYLYPNEKINSVVDASERISFSESIKKTMAWHKEKRIPERSTGIETGKVFIPTAKKMKVGIVGCGGISSVHLKKLTKLGVAKQIVLTDPNEAAMNDIAKQFKISKKYTDYKEMIEQEKPDVVHIITPPQFHAEIAMFASENNCHVLVEKPMAVNAEEAEKMVQAARKNKKKICVMHNHLYDDVMLKARDLIALGELGTITYVDSWYGVSFRDEYSNINPATHWKYGLPGSVYQDFVPHGLYVVLDQIKDAQFNYAVNKCAAKTPKVESDELKFFVDNAAQVGLVNVSLSTSPRHQFMNIYGTSGTLTLDFLNQYVFLNNTAGPIPNSIGRVLSSRRYGTILKRSGRRNLIGSFTGKYELFQGTERLIALFYRSILMNEPEPVPGEEGLKVMQIMDEVWQNINKNNR
jgi:predicted dehydrogenase/nucleoside-diphosphate-sugar epimerase